MAANTGPFSNVTSDSTSTVAINASASQNHRKILKSNPRIVNEAGCG
jgi:hypothetical protein